MKKANHEGWVLDAKKTLDWFIETMGETKWFERRMKVAAYFHALEASIYTEANAQEDGFEKKFAPVAVYTDWVGWYMYLVESVFERQGCDDPSQSARIFPFFSAIGRGIPYLEAIPGIRKRLQFLLNEKQNAPDSSLYELVVAFHYARQGWTVSFVEERSSGKTPDLEISKGAQRYWVECKRFAKVNEYAETERQEWQKRVKHLFNSMRISHVPAFAEVIFKVPIEDTEEKILGDLFRNYLTSGMLERGETFVDSKIQFKAVRLDMKRINSVLEEQVFRPGSSQMIQLLTGDYIINGNYTELLRPLEVQVIEPENPLYILNKFYGRMLEAYIAKWDCIASHSIDKKAKEINKMLSKALNQIPEQGDGIIHIGYETVTGPAVEVKRSEKIRQVIQDFQFGSKNICAVFFNAMQFLTKPDGSDWAETILYFEKDINSQLPKNLLLAPDETELRKTTHWEEDMLSGKAMPPDF